MYIQEISLKIKSGIDYETLLETFDSLMRSYRGSGQTQGKIESKFVTNNTIFCYPYTLEEDALSAKYNNHYVNLWSEKVEEIAKAKLQFKTVGKSHKDYDGQCKSPCCGGEWLLHEKLHDEYYFKCNTCRIISSLSNNRP